MLSRACLNDSVLGSKHPAQRSNAFSGFPFVEVRESENESWARDVGSLNETVQKLGLVKTGRLFTGKHATDLDDRRAYQFDRAAETPLQLVYGYGRFSVSHLASGS